MFEDCRSLKNVTIPDSVTSIGLWAFCGCFGIADPSGIHRGADQQFVSIAAEATAANVTAALLEYKNTHFPDIDPMAEFTLDW